MVTSADVKHCAHHVLMPVIALLSDCGNEIIPMTYNLRSSTAATAGLHAFTHDNQNAGMLKSETYHTAYVMG